MGGDRGGGAVAEASVAGACGRRLKPGVTSNRRKRRKRHLGGGKLFCTLGRAAVIGRVMVEAADAAATTAGEGTAEGSDAAATTAGEGAAEGPAFECAICWQDVCGEPATLPCCGRAPAGSTTVYCARCLEIICETSPCGVGRCPTCSGFMQKAPGGGLTVAAGIDECGVCHQARPVAERLRGTPVCGACSLGVRHPLRYECERCHRVQRIPHPMYRYQVDGPAAFGNNSWFCGGGECQDFTKWRVHPADVQRVPADDCPEAWGRREDWFAQVRVQRLREATAAGAADADAVALPLTGGPAPLLVRLGWG